MVNKSKGSEDKIVHVQRWLALIDSQDAVKAAATTVAAQARAAKDEVGHASGARTVWTRCTGT